MELHNKLKKHLEEQKKEWKSFIYASGEFYQGYDKVGVKGRRSTEQRFKSYGIEHFLTKDKRVLDIGCNCGFTTLYAGERVRHADGVEINPFLIKIGEDTRDFLGLNNVTFFASSFENFVATGQYDIVFSFANDETIDGNTKFTFKEYILKIKHLLKKDGLLIFESQAFDTDEKLFAPKLAFLKEQFGVLESKRVDSDYPTKVKDRIFLVLKTK